MSWNDDFNEEDPFYDDPEANEEALQEIKKEKERIRNMPLMKKAGQIIGIVTAIAATLPDDNEIALHYRELLITDACTIGARIAGAEGGDIFRLRMENAVMVKIAACNLLTQSAGMNMLGLVNEEYCSLLRTEIEEFRMLFVNWVSSFDRNRDVPDEWGLFT